MRLPLAVIGGLAGLAAMLAGAMLSLAPAAADGHLDSLNKLPSDLELVLSLSGNPDNIVQAGEQFTVEAALRYAKSRSEVIINPYRAWVIPTGSDSQLRMGGGLAWEAAGSRRLKPAAQSDFGAVGFTKLKDEPANSFLRAFDQRTIVTHVSVNNVATLLIYDAWSKELAATVTRPAGTQDSWFGRGHYTNLVSYMTDSVSVWHETESTAWMFVGAARDTVAGLANTGRVHIYRLDWGDRAVEATLATTLAPPASEVNNRHAATGTVYYGNSLNLSDDGSTLAVTAMNMNQMGAVYVYTRPDGPGQNWGDIRYADGVKVTPVAIPSHGSNTATAPFNAAALSTCDAYCSRAHSFIEHNVEFAVRRVRLSADGRVLVTGASEKRYSMETPGGGFVNANQRDNKGEVYVWVAPEGGWNAAPRADMDEQGTAKTLIAAKADASSFNPATHYSPGPLRRITEPSAVLVERLWTQTGGHPLWIGDGLGISPDGTTVVADADTQYVGYLYVFQQSSVAGWEALGERALNDRYMTPTASITGVGRLTATHRNTTFSSDGRTMFINAVSQLHVLPRPATGTWADINAGTSPDVARLRAGSGADMRQDSLDGSRVVFAQGATYTSDGGCTVEVADGTESFSCVIPINGTVLVPEGAADGTFTISAQLTVQLEGLPDSAVRLEDTLEARIGAPPKLTEAQIGPANDWRGTTDTADDRPFPSLVEPGGKTRLQLQILDETGQLAATSRVSSLVLTTTLGGLTSLVRNGACVGASGQTSCAIPAAALAAQDSDEVLFELAHTGTAGAATVWAALVSAEGESLTSNRFTVDVAGPPTALAIAEPSATLLGYAPADDTDPRNKTTLIVSATDAGDNRASVPDTVYSAKLTDPDGKTVALGSGQRAQVEWPLRNAAGDRLLQNGNPQARVTIAAAAASPLATGEYTLELSAGSAANKLTATQTVVVAGGAAGVALSADPEGAIAAGSSVTVTATVTDASGSPVPDGTPVHFTEGATGSNAVLVLVSQSRQRTSGGQASVTAQAVGLGSAYIQAQADTAADLQTITVVAQTPAPLSELVGDLTIDSYAIWPHLQRTTAAALFNAMDGLSQISQWDGAEWISYGESAGFLLPGSIDFDIAQGDVLWLTGR